MRITNKIMQRNNLSNINTNKMYQDRLSAQMSSQKKINRPSDDPVVAIRSLRLRSNVTEITQYYSKNIPDADSWLKVTEDAISNLADIMTNMIARCNKGVDSYLTTANRQIILEEMQNLSKEVYATGDADYAGRYVFTGYRTDTPLSFLEAKQQIYGITEQIDKNAMDSVSKVETNTLLEINSTNYMAHANVNEDAISSVDVYRIRLAYNDCSDQQIPSIEYTDANGITKVWTGEIETWHSYDKIGGRNPYAYVAAEGNEGKIVFIPETGELLLGKNRYETLMATKDNETTPNKNEAEIKVTYRKDNWKKGDLRPEHYFACKAVKEDGTEIAYNQNYLDQGAQRQSIEYDVGFNQSIRVNSTADECFKHSIGREVEDIVRAMQDVLDLEKIKTDLEALQGSGIDGEYDKKIQDIKANASWPTAALEAQVAQLEQGKADSLSTIQKQIDAAQKALTFAKRKEQELFQSGITVFQKQLDDANLCVTNCGSRRSKLELIENRTQNQKTTYETLKSENEDIDITEVAILLNAAELTYNAALMASGKVMQTTLLNYL